MCTSHLQLVCFIDILYLRSITYLIHRHSTLQTISCLFHRHSNLNIHSFSCQLKLAYSSKLLFWIFTSITFHSGRVIAGCDHHLFGAGNRNNVFTKSVIRKKTKTVLLKHMHGKKYLVTFGD